MILGGAAAAWLASAPMGWADATTNPPPDFKEVYDLIRSHLAGESETDLDQAAVQGLLEKLRSRVSLVSNTSPTNTAPEKSLLTKSVIYDGPIAYLRVGQVGQGLAGQITSSLKELSTSNQLKGIVIDLRFADGHDYAAAADAADLFLSKEVPLLDWGGGFVKSKAKSDAITLPVTVLVNRQTAAAAEALAAVLRETGRAMILGATTAGEATIGEDFPLKNGQYLRIASAAVKLGNGESLSANGVKPDIQVPVRPEDEKIYFEDPFRELPSSASLIAAFGGTPAPGNGTNRTSRTTRTTEADLIRERKERPGMDLEYATPETDANDEKPMIHDPVLGRALDLIKAISVLKQNHTP